MPLKLIPLDPAYLAECFTLDHDTGAIYWKTRPREHFRTSRGWRTFTSQKAGKRADVAGSPGYRCVCLDKVLLRAHRVAYAMATGKDPTDQIDHKNRDGVNNKPMNLREATNGQNQLNKSGWKTSASGIKGVYPKGSKFQVKFRLLGSKRFHVGTFASIDEAKAAYAEAIKQHHGAWAFGAEAPVELEASE
jgi:hypothetical protein